MLDNLLIVSQQVGILFCLMAIGFTIGKLKWLDRVAAGNLSTLLLYGVAPCMLVSSLQLPRTPELLTNLLWGGLFLAVQYGALILLSHLTFRRVPRQTQTVLRFSQVYANTFFMGMPLIQGIFGAQAGVFVIPAMVVFPLFQWTHAVSLMGGKFSLKKALLNPGIIGIAVGLVFFLAQITLPEVIGTAFRYVGGMNTPLSMLIIGLQMSLADFKPLFTNKRVYQATAYRLLVGPAVSLLLLLPLSRWMDPDLVCTLLILSGTPVASVTSIMAQQFDQDATTAAQVVTMSTLFSMLTLPFVAMLAKTITGI